MPITAQGTAVPVERKEIDISTASVAELREHRQALTERSSEFARNGQYVEVNNTNDRRAAVGGAIADRANGREVNAQDRDFMLNGNQKQAEVALNAPGVRERLAAQDLAYNREHGYTTPKPVVREQSSKDELASVAATTLKNIEPRIEKEWAQALRKDGSEAVNARFEANLQGLNTLRKDLIERHPDWEQKLPPAVNIQEVSQRIAEQVREQRMGQQLSR